MRNKDASGAISVPAEAPRVELDELPPPVDLPAAFRWVRATMTPQRWLELSRIAGTGLITILYWQKLVPQWVLLIAVVVGLYPLLKIGLIDLVRDRKLGTEIFVSLATIIALATGETMAGAVIMVIILIAEFIAEINTDRARASIQRLIGSVPRTATLVEAGRHRVVSIAQLRVGDIVLVHAGEKIPVDGAVVEGTASVNEAPITGESIPRDKAAGDEVFAGTVLDSGALDVRTQKVGADTTFARIVQLVEQAQEHQAPVQKLTDRVAAWLIPVVLLFLALVFIFTRDARLIVTLLIFTSPAELGLATPLVMISAIARAARGGVLVKGGVYLESLAKVDAIVFDKTGTLTTGKPQVTAAIPAEGADLHLLLRVAAAADRRSSHPLALAVVRHVMQMGIDFPEPTDFETLQGRGVRATVQGQVVLLGTRTLLLENGIEPPDPQGQPGQTCVYVAWGTRALGILYFADQVRPEAPHAIARLRATGVRWIVMLTGDNESTAQAVAQTLGVDEVHANLLPGHKVDAIRELQRQGYRVAMVGDGINDAPALAAAEVGVAMGAGGTQAAIEAADVALMTDDLSKIVLARTIARRAYRTIQENLLFGIGVVHVLGITAALLGLIGPVAAALLHLGPDVMVFLNSVKLLRVRLE
jgi:heavy metal translocating P-type ATPase